MGWASMAQTSTERQPTSAGRVREVPTENGGSDVAPLNHLLWRLSENRDTQLTVQIRASCSWASCPTGQITWTMRLVPGSSKPTECYCVLCSRPLQVLAAGPLP